MHQRRQSYRHRTSPRPGCRYWDDHSRIIGNTWVSLEHPCRAQHLTWPIANLFNISVWTHAYIFTLLVPIVVVFLVFSTLSFIGVDRNTMGTFGRICTSVGILMSIFSDDPPATDISTANICTADVSTNGTSSIQIVCLPPPYSKIVSYYRCYSGDTKGDCWYIYISRILWRPIYHDNNMCFRVLRILLGWLLECWPLFMYHSQHIIVVVAIHVNAGFQKCQRSDELYH